MDIGKDLVAASATPLILGIVAFTSILVLVFNLLVDIAYGFIDPRIRY